MGKIPIALFVRRQFKNDKYDENWVYISDYVNVYFLGLRLKQRERKTLRIKKRKDTFRMESGIDERLHVNSLIVDSLS
jgi:hypothetical protein